jgi:signal transduction histidine kinase
MDSLNSSDQKLREVNNDMENKVKLRTKELSSSNKKLIREMEHREKTHNELLKTREKLNRQENLANVGQVSSNIAHELRNPMTAIRNSVYFLRKHFITDSKALHHLEVIDDELSQSDEVIERLLELTKGKKIKLKTTDLRKIAHDAYLICTPPRNIQLKIKLEEATKEIRLDPLLFRQILTNLFSNSIQAMPQGGDISLIAIQKESTIEIRVTDNGEGIPKESWNKVFDPLYTNKKDGIGLGLSLCRELMERHNGSITIEKSSNSGTTFLILLPAPSLIFA